MDEVTLLKEELNRIRITVDRSNPYMKQVLDELYSEPVDRLRSYVEKILEKEIVASERLYYERLLRTI
jgi:hypothetical protein